MKGKFSILVFDTNIFLTGIDFNIIDGTLYTTPRVIEEIKANKYKEKNRNILNKINVAIDREKLKIKIPKTKFIDIVSKKSKLTGDFKALSIADKELIALALELMKIPDQEVKVYTNDYTLENVCSELKIPFAPLYKEGIKTRIIWEIYCPYCKDIRNSEDLDKICEICGSKLKRRPKRNMKY